MPYHLIKPVRARKQYDCNGCENPILPGTIYSREHYRMVFTSGKSFVRLKRYHHMCFFLRYIEEVPDVSEARAKKRNPDRQKLLNRRNYLIRQVLRPLEMTLGAQYTEELLSLSRDLDLDMSQARYVTYDREKLLEKVAYYTNGEVRPTEI